jgi:hypothetical protein
MLVGERETEYGGGEDGKVHTILLNDMHGEYTGDFETRVDGFPYGVTELAWQTSKIQDTLQELRGFSADLAESQALSLMREFLPLHFIRDNDAYIEWVWRLTGSKEYLEIKFRELHDTLRVDSVSGDDDAFDYWPNTMDMLWDFACDLDDITGSTVHRESVWEVAQWVFVGTVGQDPYNKGHLDEYRRQLFVSEWGLDRSDQPEGWRSWYLLTLGPKAVG